MGLLPEGVRVSNWMQSQEAKEKEPAAQYWAPFLVRESLFGVGPACVVHPTHLLPPTGILASFLKGQFFSPHTQPNETHSVLGARSASTICHPGLRSHSVLVRKRCSGRLQSETLPILSRGSSRRSHFFGKCPLYSSWSRQWTKETGTFSSLVTKERMDADNNLFSFVIAYLLSPTGKIE